MTGSRSLMATGSTGTLTGGEGRDTVVLDLSAISDFDYTIVADDTAVSAVSLRFPYDAMEVFEARTAGGSQTLDGSAFSGSVVLHAGHGDDTLVGGAQADSLFGGSGSDVLEPGAGRDTVAADSETGLPGSDTIGARDSEADVIDCGTGAPIDSVVADRADRLTGCERADVPAARRRHAHRCCASRAHR